MDAVKYLKERIRMCSSLNCCKCPLCAENNEMRVNCQEAEKNHTEEAVAIVEKWSAEHPVKTRQSEFLKMFSNAEMRNGFILICPKKIDQNSVTSEECAKNVCLNCMRQYWLEEVE